MTTTNDDIYPQELITVTVAAKALNVTVRTVRRYLESGRLPKVMQGTRLFIPADAVRILRDEMDDSNKVTKKTVSQKEGDSPSPSVTLSLTDYNALLFELGALRKQSQILLEDKTRLEEQARELETAKARIAELEARVITTRRKSWWTRFFGND